MARGSSKDSRQLSWLLRHGAGEAGLTMDEAGWARVSDVLRISGLTPERLNVAVETNDKGRLQFDPTGGQIRACQGHSLEGMPVTRKALEASWEAIIPAAPLWHGTSIAALAGIVAAGIVPSARTHVHLAESPTSKVGKRARVDVLIEVSPASLADSGLGIFRAPNGVVLVRYVPVPAIVAVHPAEAGASEAIVASGLPLGEPAG